MQHLISVNKEILPLPQAHISAMDQGLLFGWGLFETLCIYDGKPFMLEEHIQRMTSSAQCMGMHMPMSIEELTSHIDRFIEAAHIYNRVLRITLTKDGTLLLTHRPVAYTKESYRRGFAVKVASIRRNPTSPLTFMKTLNYMDNILAKQEAAQAGYQEALLLNGEGLICEGSMSNVFWIKEGCLYTPAIPCGLLPGIARQLVMNGLAPSLGLNVLEGEYALEYLIKADEAFITNSVMQIMSLRAVDGITIGTGKSGRATVELMKAYDACVGR